MDPVTAATVAIGLLNRPELATLLKLLTEKVSNAQQQYARAPAAAKAEDPLEAKRHECLSLLIEIRQRATLCVCNIELQQRALCLTMAYMLQAYEGASARSLDLVLVNAQQLKAVLVADEHVWKRRHQHRRIGVIVSFVSLICIGSFVAYAQWVQIDAHSALPFLGIPACVIFWSAIGSFAAILYRFTNAGDAELGDPLRWLYSRPLTGIIIGSLTFLVLKAGLLTLTKDAQSAAAGVSSTSEIVLLVAFVAGFSDRFSDGLLRSLIGNFGGDNAGDLVSMEPLASRITPLDFLPVPGDVNGPTRVGTQVAANGIPALPALGNPT